MNYESIILSVYNSAEYLQLKEYYGKGTMFSILGIARSENRHSAFIAWLLNAVSDHNLGTEPLKKLLGLYALRSETISNSLKIQLITGHYRLQDVTVSTEKTLKNYEGSEENLDKQKRLDIVCSFTIVSADTEDAEDTSLKVLLVIENKVYSKEGCRGGKKQTQIYHDVLAAYCDKYNEELLEIFLTPDEEQTPACQSYCKLTYQDLLDSVITPLSFMSMDGHASMLIDDYIRNLGVPAFNMDDKEQTTDEYSIMATSKEEVCKLNALFNLDGFTELFTDAILAKYEDKAFPLCGSNARERFNALDAEKSELLIEFWNTNIDIFKAIMRYVEPYQSMDCNALFKKNNRDNSKYRVKLDGHYIFSEKPSLSKAMTALAIFHAYAKKNEGKNITVQDMNAAFPCKDINEYYFKNYYKNLFYPYSDQLPFDSENTTHNNIMAQSRWNFYVNPSPLITIGLGTMKVMVVKMWRKADFDRLLNHIRNHEEFAGIVVEEIA